MKIQGSFLYLAFAISRVYCYETAFSIPLNFESYLKGTPLTPMLFSHQYHWPDVALEEVSEAHECHLFSPVSELIPEVLKMSGAISSPRHSVLDHQIDLFLRQLKWEIHTHFSFQKWSLQWVHHSMIPSLFSASSLYRTALQFLKSARTKRRARKFTEMASSLIFYIQPFFSKRKQWTLMMRSNFFAYYWRFQTADIVRRMAHIARRQLYYLDRMSANSTVTRIANRLLSLAESDPRIVDSSIITEKITREAIHGSHRYISRAIESSLISPNNYVFHKRIGFVPVHSLTSHFSQRLVNLAMPLQLQQSGTILPASISVAWRALREETLWQDDPLAFALVTRNTRLLSTLLDHSFAVSAPFHILLAAVQMEFLPESTLNQLFSRLIPNAPWNDVTFLDVHLWQIGNDMTLVEMSKLSHVSNIHVTTLQSFLVAVCASKRGVEMLKENWTKLPDIQDADWTAVDGACLKAALLHNRTDMLAHLLNQTPFRNLSLSLHLRPSMRIAIHSAIRLGVVHSLVQWLHFLVSKYDSDNTELIELIEHLFLYATHVRNVNLALNLIRLAREFGQSQSKWLSVTALQCIQAPFSLSPLIFEVLEWNKSTTYII